MTETSPVIRHDWSRDEVKALFDLSFNDLVFRAHCAHRAHFDPDEVQVSTLMSIKTGACPEDCKYCPQSVRYDTGLEREALVSLDSVVAAAKALCHFVPLNRQFPVVCSSPLLTTKIPIRYHHDV